ncbi:TRAP transporter permease [Hippea maritima]|uniref:TRAP transporter, 4TM/12TM fusion protein n=1 Tax=Hippea maritima (strain ATCC 700847 / DSM 10411 / MH2) TaxID=760142 RepID=F2LX19_HIPMA|nr:TRAP transporter fused permease subunit [Hippea maritima]AEA34203.1 TRAP transporter, 4TM/12TM fusion protein [Hippea maritima DSM 10411]
MDQKSKQEELIEAEAGSSVRLRNPDSLGFLGLLVKIASVFLALFALWYNSFGVISELHQNAIFFSIIGFIGFILYPLSKKKAKQTLKIDVVLAFLVLISGLYIVFFENTIHARNEVLILRDIIIGSIAIILLIELSRRAAGLVIPLLAILFSSYALFLGKYMPPGMFSFRGIFYSTYVYRMYFTNDGIFGYIATIASTYVYLFILFAAFFLKSGAGDFIIDMAKALLGKTVGGPAKVAVLASGLMGSITGSSVANVVGTGSITIPLMKRIGFAPEFAGGVETAASVGGQMMPPIMGAGAFIMAQWTQIPYTTIIGKAFIPAVMYYLGVLLNVHIRAVKSNLKPLDDTEIPSVKEVFKKGWHFLIPLVVLVYLLVSGYTPTYAAIISIVAVVVSSWIRKNSRMGPKEIIDAMILGTRNMVGTGILLLVAGIIVGIITLTGLGISLSIIVTSITSNSIFLLYLFTALAALFLGMGLPVTASYIVLAILIAPAFKMLGVGILAANMVVFWLAETANVTPPIALAAFAASGIAGSKPVPTAIEGFKLAKGLLLIPILFLYTNLLAGLNGNVIVPAVSGLFGLFGFTVFLEGYWGKHLNIFERLLFLIFGLLAYYPSIETDAVGVLGEILLFGYYYLKGKKAKA